MAPSAKPETFRRQLVTALANRDVALGVFLGAGCGASVTVAGAPLIPPIARLSALVCADVRSSHKPLMAVLEKQFTTDRAPCSPNVEELLSRIRALKDVAGEEGARGLKTPDLDALDEAISAGILRHVSADLPEGVTSYSQFARWAAGFDRRTPLEVFTTNYDLLVEQALERARWPFFDGFVGSCQPFFDLTAIEIDTIPVRWLRLWKIHGSINWRMSGEWVVRSREGKKLLIYPSHLKYAESRRMPYLAIRDRLRNFFRVNPCVFLTCGYSFGDQHINEDISAGLRANRGAVCFALLFEKLATYPQAIAIAHQHPNLTLLAPDMVVSRSSEIAWESDHVMNLGDFAHFAEFLVTDIMGRSADDAS